MTYDTVNAGFIRRGKTRTHAHAHTHTRGERAASAGYTVSGYLCRWLSGYLPSCRRKRAERCAVLRCAVPARRPPITWPAVRKPPKTLQVHCFISSSILFSFPTPSCCCSFFVFFFVSFFAAKQAGVKLLSLIGPFRFQLIVPGGGSHSKCVPDEGEGRRGSRERQTRKTLLLPSGLDRNAKSVQVTGEYAMSATQKKSTKYA